MDQQKSAPVRDVDDSPIHEELAQVSPYIGCCGAVRCADIDQQYACFRALHRYSILSICCVSLRQAAETVEVATMRVTVHIVAVRPRRGQSKSICTSGLAIWWSLHQCANAHSPAVAPGRNRHARGGCGRLRPDRWVRQPVRDAQQRWPVDVGADRLVRRGRDDRVVGNTVQVHSVPWQVRRCRRMALLGLAGFRFNVSAASQSRVRLRRDRGTHTSPAGPAAWPRRRRGSVRCIYRRRCVRPLRRR